MVKQNQEQTMETVLNRIAQRSKEDGEEFKWLMPHFNFANLYTCFMELDGNKAVGVDGMTKEEYGRNIVENLKGLLEKMKRMSYRPGAVREVRIPKEGQKGKYRPLGISCFEDKIVQLMTSKILEAIYEPVFRDCSHGFRPNRNCHTAVKALSDYLYKKWYTVVLDIDLKNYFGTIDHKRLIEFLRLKIKDECFLRYLVRMLKAGVLSDGELRRTEEGSPQGNVASPVLSNVYGHYVLDTWFEDVVKNHVYGEVELYRYCDDIVICCEYDTDAERIMKALKGRLVKYGLEMNAEKSRIVRFDKRNGVKKENRETFDFLGFTFYLGKSKTKTLIPQVRTSRKRLRSKLQNINQWCKETRNRSKLKELWNILRSKLRGHIQYYSISFNLPHVRVFVIKAVRIFFKWMNRRSQRKSFNWCKFNQFIGKNPLPEVKVCFSLF
jgi:RNA-directed DNA polymerase